MHLKEIKTIFHKELDALYAKEEVDSFFAMMMEQYLGLERFALALHPNLIITKEEEQPFFEGLAELKLERPLQYILGKAHFMELDFIVNEKVLIPRPETEELVRWILKEVQGTKYKVQGVKYKVRSTKDEKGNTKLEIRNTKWFGQRTKDEKTKDEGKLAVSSPWFVGNTKEEKASGDTDGELRILDIGTGSGCIAISLAKNLPNAKVYALDVSEEALEVAKENAALNGVDVNFVQTDILTVDSIEVKFDIIVSNPPYVRELEKTKIKNNVKRYEPDLSLFVSDEDPLIFYKHIVQFALRNLNNDGLLFFEINQFLGKETQQILEDQNFSEIELRKDMFGNDRMVRGKAP